MSEAERTTHRRVVVSKHGGPEVLQVIEEDLPTPKQGEARVAVQAAGVSAYDLMHRSSGKLPGVPKVPFTLGEDFVGVVDAVGEGVASVVPGQRVAGFTFGESGCYTEHLCRPADELVPVPDGLGSAEAVCLVVNYLTAYQQLHETADVSSGDRVLVHGAAGGVGSALLELCGLVGAELYGTASKRNHEFVSARGATPIDYRSEDFVARIRELTGDGVDTVFDPVGGARQVWRSSRALRKGGRLVWFGMAATKDSGLRVIPYTLFALAVLKLLPNGKEAPLAPDLGAFSEAHEGWYRETLATLLALAAAGELSPTVAERIPLVDAVRAHELLERGGYIGKIVLVTDTDH